MNVQDMEKLFYWVVDRVIWSLAIALVLYALYTLLVLTPMSLYHEAKCLEAGYPESQVTMGLSVYCIGIDGAVIDRVHKL